MKIIRYHNSPSYLPSNSHTTLLSEMDRLFETAFPAFNNRCQAEFPVDLYQDKNDVIARAELPGFRKEDLEVEVADDVLTVSAHRRSEVSADKENKVDAARQERKITRSISLPENLQVDKVQATYENGVLTIRLPKNEEVKPKQIVIEVK